MISIIPLSFVYPNSKLDIIFPNDFILNNSITVSSIKNANVNLKYSISNNLINISNFTTTYIENDAIIIQISNIKNPKKSMNTSSFGVILKDSFNSLTEIQNDGLEYTVTAGLISDISIISDSYVTDKPSKYTISFQLQNYLSYFGIYKI